MAGSGQPLILQVKICKRVLVNWCEVVWYGMNVIMTTMWTMLLNTCRARLPRATKDWGRIRLGEGEKKERGFLP